MKMSELFAKVKQIGDHNPPGSDGNAS
jgi:hypothetical protein